MAIACILIIFIFIALVLAAALNQQQEAPDMGKNDKKKAHAMTTPKKAQIPQGFMLCPECGKPRAEYMMIIMDDKVPVCCTDCWGEYYQRQSQ